MLPGRLTGAELRATREGTLDLRLPEHPGSPVLTDHEGNTVPLTAVPGDDRRFRLRLLAGARYRLSAPGDR